MGKERNKIEEILRRNGMDQFNNGPDFSKFKCPICGGSLVLIQGKKQRRVLMRCVDGCNLNDILLILGIEIQDLFHKREPNSSHWLNSGEGPR